MAVKHNPQASLLITEAIEKMEPFAQKICTKLRKILNVNFPELIEDWKWGPNYYYEGMVCGFWGMKKHASLIFHNGATLKDPKKILIQMPGSLNTRHMRFTEVTEIDEKTVIAYVKEAININKKGIGKIKLSAADKVVELHPEFKKALSKAKLLKKFEEYTYYKRKEMAQWVNDAKREETRLARIVKSVDLISEGKSLMDKFRK